MSRERTFMLDIGGVLKIPNSESEIWKTPSYLETPTVPGTETWLPEITKIFRHRRVRCIVVSCTRDQTERQKKARWFEYHKLAHITGVQPGEIIFCNDRPEKAAFAEVHGTICAIDNKMAVLGPMKDAVALRILFRPNNEQLTLAKCDNGLSVYDKWMQVHNRIKYDTDIR